MSDRKNEALKQWCCWSLKDAFSEGMMGSGPLLSSGGKFGNTEAVVTGNKYT